MLKKLKLKILVIKVSLKAKKLGREYVLSLNVVK
jgi:hypothetical protein